MSSDNGSAKVARLRDAIDSGQTRGKVGVADPSAAPLGTDEEAAGTPVTSLAARVAFDQEVQDSGQQGRGRVDPHLPTDTREAPWALIAMAVVIAAVAIVIVMSLTR